MAMSMGMMNSMVASSSSIGSWARRGGVAKGRRKAGRSRGDVRCAAAASLADQYRMLRVQPGAPEKEVKKAFRKLALQYHPDVCKGSNCGVQFHRINEAYDIVMSSLRQADQKQKQEQWQRPEWSSDGFSDEGMSDSGWDLWEEWMGWEGAGIRDYSSHINPYI
ncbi:chaperone protein dnaJ 8, chloroplastic-like [Musa acuminata AAA Group]|uniref:chaperone protein dnaJ 8, chloroplastic-like n=1 Tax=Musa acuminata AAA Group TaxID=214697 RepID=UPI0031D80134